ncbi:MAG: hypothetical protein M3Q10_08955, partial [Chloroflexota bacterium]|nr:hypothetical protein [Chloroflexota bacterium]
MKTPVPHTIAVRAYPVILDDRQKPTSSPRSTRSNEGDWLRQWPRQALIFDCETRIDASQRLTVGFAVVLRSDWRQNRHEVAAIICFADEAALSRPERLTLEAWLAGPLNELLARLGVPPGLVIPDGLSIIYRSVEEFREIFYAVGYRGRGVVAGFNLGFDISRVAVRATPTRDRRGFTFTLIDKVDSRGRKGTKLRHPRIRIVPIDGTRALMQFTGTKPRFDGHFLELKTFGDALTGRRHTLDSAARTFGVGEKRAHDHDGRVTRHLLDYALVDVLATAALYVAQITEYRTHPLGKPPDRIYSEASIGKAYLEELGLVLPDLVPHPALGLTRDEVMGLATTTYYGGRTECRIRGTLVPVSYCDFLSMYPTVNSLMGLWDVLTAEQIRVVDATAEVQAFLDRVTPEDLFAPDTWRQLPAVVELVPEDDVLPVRARYGDETESTYGIGINPLTSDRPLWYALADVLVAKLRTGRAPRIRRALRFVPDGRQALEPVKLRGQVLIDPARRDLFREAIVARRAVKHGEPPYDRLTREERDRLQQFLKILVNATSYGIYMEMNRQQGETARVRAYGLQTVELTIDGPEEQGPYCFPPLATTITAGARLMLALAEHAVRERGGHYAFMDTDSVAIVATETGGLLPCPGGVLQLPDGTPAIRALSWAEVEQVRDRFRALNPYGADDSVLELEAENYARCGMPNHPPTCTCTRVRQPLWVYSIASKRYALVNLEGDRIDVRKYSEHGLGAYEAPRNPETGKRIAKWERDIWLYLIAQARGQPARLPGWAGQAALTRVRIARPEQLRWFDPYNRRADGDPLSYEEGVKPSNFLSHAVLRPRTALPTGIDRSQFCLVA